MYQYLFSISIWLDDQKSKGLELQKQVSLDTVPNLNMDITIDHINLHVSHMVWLHNKDMFFVIAKPIEANNNIEKFETTLQQYKDDGWVPSYTFRDLKDKTGIITPRRYQDAITIN